MAIFTTTEDRTVYSSRTFHLNPGILNVGPFSEEATLITLAATEEVACDRVIDDLAVDTRNTYGTSCHNDDA